MAVGNNQKRNYYSIRNGKVFKSCEENTPGATKIVTKAGTVKFGILYDYIDGFISQIGTKKATFNNEELTFLTVALRDFAGEVDQLEFPLGSNFFRSLALSFPNIDLSLQVRLTPYQTEKDGKKRSGLWISQGNENVPWYYTKETPHGIPEWEPLKNKKGEIVSWDNSEQTEFLMKAIEEKMKAGAFPSTHVEESGDVLEEKNTSSDDLPF